MRPSITFERKEYVLTVEPPPTLVQVGPVVLIGKKEVVGIVNKLRRYIEQLGPQHPKYESRKAKHDAFLDLLEQDEKLQKKGG